MRRTMSQRQRKKGYRMEILCQIKDLPPQERARVIEKIQGEPQDIPFSKKQFVSRATIYRWYRAFCQGGPADSLLLPKIRVDLNQQRSLTPMQKEALCTWRRENIYRTVEDLREELMAHPETAAPTVPSRSTIARFLNQEGLSRSVLLKARGETPRIRLAFEAEYPQQIWIGDTKGPNVFVTDPQDPSRSCQAMPIAFIDGYSRYLPGVEYVVAENEDTVLACLGEAILRYGIPETLYLDRGGSYMGKRLRQAMTLLGCRVMHTGTRQCEAKGLIEKMLRTLHERFEQEMLAKGKTTFTLAEYNQYMAAHVEMDYHRSIHASTGQTPEDRYRAFPPQYRRFISREYLMLVFMPCKTARVSKTGLIRHQNRNYLAPDARLWSKKVEVRYSAADHTRVHVWYQDRYYGEAHGYVPGNDFLKREALLQQLRERIPSSLPSLPDEGAIPPYSRLDRQLAQYRAEMSPLNLDAQLEENRRRKEEVRALILPGKPTDMPPARHGNQNQDLAELTHLLMKLLRRSFTPSERLAVQALWKETGPFDEPCVRETVGGMLGQEHPVEDLMGYLEAIRVRTLMGNKK